MAFEQFLGTIIVPDAKLAVCSPSDDADGSLLHGDGPRGEGAKKTGVPTRPGGLSVVFLVILGEVVRLAAFSADFAPSGRKVCSQTPLAFAEIGRGFGPSAGIYPLPVSPKRILESEQPEKAYFATRAVRRLELGDASDLGNPLTPNAGLFLRRETSSVEVINLDHNATTSVRPEVIEAMAEYVRLGYGNPASAHQLGARARRVLEESREVIAELLGASLTSFPPDRVIFTSGGTEANNLAILGISQAVARTARTGRPGQPHQIIISAMEHASVLAPAEHLLELGWRLDTVGATRSGVLRVDQLQQFLTPETRLVSVMLANHETGVVQPVAQVAHLCRDRGIPVHTDAVQAVGKMPVHFRRLGVSAMSVAAHKFHGPVGIGALICRGDVPISPLLFGGHQQDGYRPGTEPVALVVGMRKALELWHKEANQQLERLVALRQRFENKLKQALPDIVIHGEDAPRLPHTANIAFPGIESQVLFMALDTVGVACSIGSACASGAAEASPTLRAMGLPKELVDSSLRFSLDITNTEAEIDEAVRRIVATVERLRQECAVR